MQRVGFEYMLDRRDRRLPGGSDAGASVALTSLLLGSQTEGVISGVREGLWLGDSLTMKLAVDSRFLGPFMLTVMAWFSLVAPTRMLGWSVLFGVANASAVDGSSALFFRFCSLKEEPFLLGTVSIAEKVGNTAALGLITTTVSSLLPLSFVKGDAVGVWGFLLLGPVIGVDSGLLKDGAELVSFFPLAVSALAALSFAEKSDTGRRNG